MGGSLNRRVLEGLRKHTAEDKVLQDLVLALAHLEVDQPGWYKDPYKDLLRQHLKRWGSSGENRAHGS